MTSAIETHGRATRIYDQTVVFLACYTCGLPVAITRSQMQQYDEHGASMYCAMGHQTVRRESDNALLEKKLRQAQDSLARVETDKVNLRGLLDAEEKRARKLLKRIEAGVCPHCHRTFQNVARHVGNKHK